MTFEELGIEYCGLNVFVNTTKTAIIRICKLFDERGLCAVENLSINAVIQFKEATLSKAKVVTYNGYLRYLRIVTDYAVNEGYTKSNYFRKIKLGPVPDAPAKIISDTDLWALFNHLLECPDKYPPCWFWLSVIKTLYFTGMRRRQLVSLRRRDIDFDNEVLLMRKEGSKTHREWSIPLHPLLVNVLKDLIQKSEEVIGAPLHKDDTVFNASRLHSRYKPDQNNPSQMKADSITDFFKRVNKRTGLEVGAHKFRHTLATKMCNPDHGHPDICAAQVLLGHRELKTTRSYVATPLDRVAKTLNHIDYPSLVQKTLTR